jgi:hypothetical protein
MYVESCVVDIYFSPKRSELVPVIGQPKNHFHQDIVIFGLFYAAVHSNNILFTLNLYCVVAMIF